MENQQYFKARTGRTVLFIHKMLSPTAQRELEQRMQSSLSDTKQKKSHSTITLKDTFQQPHHFFCKTQVLRHRNTKIRSTFSVLGLGNKSPAIAEIRNNLNTLQLSYIPSLYGYGYERDSYGLISKVVIVTQLIEKSINLREFIEARSDKTTEAVLSALELIGKSIRDGVMHLDLWIENILTDKDLSNLYMIDLEYCRLKTRSSKARQLSFSIGYLYNYELNKYISKNAYFTIVEAWLKNSFSDLDIAEIITKSKAASMNRKKRLTQF